MNNDRADLNLLVVFTAVFEAGSVSVAAVRLNLSQPAVSHALNRLRALTGDPLFVRAGQRLSATPRAMAMEAQSRAVVAQARSLLAKETFVAANAAVRFCIGSSDYANLVLMPRLLRHVRQQSPASQLEIIPVGTSIRDDLEQGRADVSFWGVSPPQGPFHSCKLFDEHLVGVAWNGHPLAHRLQVGPVELESYIVYPHAVVALGVTAGNPVDAALEARGHTRNIRFVGQSFTGNLHAMRDTDLIMSLPARLLPEAEALGFVGFELPLQLEPFSYGLIWHQRTQADPALKWLRAEIVELFGHQVAAE